MLKLLQTSHFKPNTALNLTGWIQPCYPNLHFIYLPAQDTLACRQNRSMLFWFIHCLSKGAIFQPCQRVALHVFYVLTGDSLMLPHAVFLTVIKYSLQRRHLVCKFTILWEQFMFMHWGKSNMLALFAWRWQFTGFFFFPILLLFFSHKTAEKDHNNRRLDCLYWPAGKSLLQEKRWNDNTFKAKIFHVPEKGNNDLRK